MRVVRFLKILFARLLHKDKVRYICNICGSNNNTPDIKLDREVASCIRCGSTVRMRAMVRILIKELTGADQCLTEIDQRLDCRGIGLSDARGYALPLGRVLNYTNTYYHKDPHLDITNPEDYRDGMYDFVVASDVFEHVAHPVSRAFDSTRNLLKPGGLFVFSVPYTQSGETREHFPDLNDYKIRRVYGKKVLFNTDINGNETEYGDLVFHGGGGETLEMRIFSRQGVLEELCKAGFQEIKIWNLDYLEYGIKWPDPWSLPISARAP